MPDHHPVETELSDLRVALMTTEAEIAKQDSVPMVRAELFNQLLKVQEEERCRLAHELHNEAGQLITALLRKLQRIEDAQTLESARSETDSIRELAEGILREIKRISRGLRPGELDVLGLHAALRTLTDEFKRTYDVSIDTHLQELEGTRLPADVEVGMFRIVQEVLTNVARHSGAANVSVVARLTSEDIVMIIEDDGKGFDVDEAMRSKNGDKDNLGLFGIRERSQSVHGQATIESHPEHGTSVYVRLPIQQ
jgi:signal transduction histidine kinase